jgi:hypothetical protein
MEFRDLGEPTGGTEISPEGKKPGKYYPSGSFNEKKLPELKGKTVDDEVCLLIIGTVKGIHKYGNGDINYDIEYRQAVLTEDEPDEVKEKVEE